MQIQRDAVSAMAVAAVLAIGLTATPALAGKVKGGGGDGGASYVFDFSGLCTDCTAADPDGKQEFGTGVLTLQHVTDLSNIDVSNFVDFTYISNLVGVIDISSVSSFSADFSPVGTADVTIQAATAAKGSLPWSFVTTTNLDGQSWSLTQGGGGGPISQPADFGAAYTWSSTAVPEPVAWTLMIAGFGLAGAALRRQHRHTTAAAA